jgi:hypothetical protein
VQTGMIDAFAIPLPYLPDRAAVADAAALVDTYGDEAGMEAAARAERSRDLGNAVRFAHWRQIERFIVLMESDEPHGRIH